MSASNDRARAIRCAAEQAAANCQRIDGPARSDAAGILARAAGHIASDDHATRAGCEFQHASVIAPRTAERALDFDRTHFPLREH